MRKAIFLLIIISVSISLYAEPWIKWYDPYDLRSWLDSHDCQYNAYSVIRANDGGFLLRADYTCIYNPPGRDIEPRNFNIVMKTDIDGNLEWVSKDSLYADDTNLRGYNIMQAPNGLIFATGNRYVIKRNADGVVLNKWGFPYTTYDLKNTSDGNFVLLTYFGRLYKFDYDFNELWCKDLMGGTEPNTTKIEVTDDDGFILTGASVDGALLLKLDSEGEYEWHENYNQSTAFGLAIAVNGDYLICGDATNTGAYAIRIDSEGTEIWSYEDDLWGGGEYKGRL